MLNAVRDFSLVSPWHFQLGGGVGGALIAINDAQVLGIDVADDEDVAFAYQNGAGLKYRLSGSASLSLDYRYFAALDPRLRDSTGTNFAADYDRHDIRLGARFEF